MSTSQVTRALSAGPEQVGRELLLLPEDQWFDRKSIKIHPDQLAETLVAMANADGGTVVVGLRDGEVEGTALYPHKLNALMRAPIDCTVPPVRARHHLVECRRESGNEDHLLVIEVSASEAAHATRKDVCFLRVGDASRRLSFAERQELYYDKGQAQFDGTVAQGVVHEDLNAEIVADYARALRHPDPDRVLRARDLETRDGQLTQAAVLLFARRPQQWFQEAYVRVLRYEGTRPETGARQQLLDDVRCEGAIPEVLASAAEAVRRLLPRRRFLGREGRFVSEAAIPEDAWLEAIVNAVVHRSYSLGGDHIRVSLFDDRIEVDSPGRFPGMVRVQDARAVTRFARNPRIARACADLNFGQELGEGIRRMFDEMRIAGLQDPIYSQTSGSTTVVLSATSRLPDHLADELSAEAPAVLKTLRRMGRASTGEVALELHTSRPTAGRYLKALQEVGLVEWVGKSAKDPRAYWRLSTDT